MEDKSTPEVPSEVTAPITDSPVPEGETTADSNNQSDVPPTSEGEPASSPDVTPEAQEIAEWSSKRGTPIDPTDASAVRKAELERARQQGFHEARQKDTKTAAQLIDETSTDDYEALDAKIKVMEFFNQDQDRQKYKDKMLDIMNQKAQSDPYAVRFYANNLEELYKLARYEDIDTETSQAAEKARQEERERLARESQTTTGRPAATSTSTNQGLTFTKDQFSKLSPDEYAKIRDQEYTIV